MKDFLKQVTSYVLNNADKALIFGGNTVVASCSTTCADGSDCSVSDVLSCSTIASASSGSPCVTYTNHDGTTGEKKCK